MLNMSVGSDERAHQDCHSVTESHVDAQTRFVALPLVVSTNVTLSIHHVVHTQHSKLITQN